MLAGNEDDVTTWVNEMSAALAALDPNHMVLHRKPQSSPIQLHHVDLCMSQVVQCCSTAHFTLFVY